MQVQVQSIHFDADIKLIKFIEEKLQKLGTFHDRIIKSEVFLRLDKSDVNENKIAEVKLSIPGKELFAKKQCKTFEEATDVAVDALRRQIDKHRTKNS
ncbi:MAG: ribosome-associated translation inhibitor RaiA [Flavobacteriales bacterium]|nr:ribosome-associated translation inhibitor RaiA [Flavobacteriales bacterium]